MGVVRVGSDIQVNTSTAGEQEFADMATLTGGEIVVLWSDGIGSSPNPGDGSGIGIRGQIFSADGVPLGNEFLVNTETQANQTYAQVQPLSGGGFMVVWQDNSELGGDTDNAGVKAQVFTSEGAKVDDEVLVNTAVAGGQQTPKIAGLTGGNVVVVWADRSAGAGGATGDNSGGAIKGQMFTAAGEKLGDEFLVNTTKTGEQLNPSVTALTGGRFAVSWSDNSQTGGDTSGSAVRAQVFSAAAVKVGNEVLVNTHTAGDQNSSVVQALSNGNFAVVWWDQDPGGDGSGYSVKAQVISASGTKVGDEITVNTATAGNQYDYEVAALSGGGFVVTWLDFSFGVGGAQGDTEAQAIKAQVIDNSGVKVGSEILVPTSVSEGQFQPVVTATSSGGFAIAWVDGSGSDGDPSASRIQMFAADGTRLGEETRLHDATAGSQRFPAILGLSGERVFAVWNDEGDWESGSTDSDVMAHMTDFAPVVTSVDVPDDELYRTGDVLTFKVNFDEDLQLQPGLPRLMIDIGGTTRYATFSDGNGSTQLTFKYTVAADDNDLDGIGILGLDTNGGTIKGNDGDPAVLTLNAVPDLEDVRVQGNAPPTVGGLSGTAQFTEGLNEPSQAVLVAPGITVADADSANLSSATVAITGTFRVGEDELGFVSAAGMGDIQGSYNAATGVLTLTSAGGASAAEFQAALRAVTYLNTSETPYSVARTLTFQVSDGTSPSIAATRTVKVIDMDDTPSGSDATLNVLEDQPRTLAAADFGFSDTDGGTLRGVTITTIPTGGVLKLDGETVLAGDVISRDDLDEGFLVYRPPADASGVSYSFTFQVMDDLGEDYSGQAVDQSPNTLTLSLAPVSDAPAGSDGTLTAAQDASRALTVADFGFSDPDGDSLASVKIIALPAHGALTLDGVAVSANQTVSAGDIAAGKLVFVPAPGQHGAAYATLTFQVQDTGSTANGGQNLDASFNTLTFNVTEAPPEPPPSTPSTPTVDGVPVTTTPGTSPSGTPTQTVTIPVVQPTRTDTVGGNNVADIPLVTGGGSTLLSVQVPAGFGLTVSGPSTPQTAGGSLTDLIREIQAHTPSGSADQTSLTGGGSGFLGSLTSTTPLLVQTVVPTGGGAGAPPLVINGTAAAGHAMTALVIDTRSLPAGSALQLNNVDFAAIVGAVTVTGGAGSQTVYGDGASQSLFLGADDDELHGGGGTDTVASAAGADRLFGDEGNDSVSGGIGDDLVHGNAGADTVSGGEGNDLAYGGKDNDRVTGEGGHDRIFGDLGDDFLQGNAGTDSLDGGAGADTVHGGQDADQVTGGEGDDAVLGDAGDDVLQGGLGNDTATGGIGADLIHGGQGADVIYGGDGADWLSGDKGADTLSGGAGADVFHANAETGLDWITAFSFAEGDRVLLDLGTTYAVSQGASGVVIDISGGAQMVLAGVQLASLGDGWIGLG